MGFLDKTTKVGLLSSVIWFTNLGDLVHNQNNRTNSKFSGGTLKPPVNSLGGWGVPSELCVTALGGTFSRISPFEDAIGDLVALFILFYIERVIKEQVWSHVGHLGWWTTLPISSSRHGKTHTKASSRGYTCHFLLNFLVLDPYEMITGW